eukprot:15330045-Ditylum_brightwellii.AAC.2
MLPTCLNDHHIEFEDLDLDVIKVADVLHLGGTGLMSALDNGGSLRVFQFGKEHGVTTMFDLVAIP